jgi:hypothetical protein
MYLKKNSFYKELTYFKLLTKLNSVLKIEVDAKRPLCYSTPHASITLYSNVKSFTLAPTYVRPFSRSCLSLAPTLSHEGTMIALVIFGCRA